MTAQGKGMVTVASGTMLHGILSMVCKAGDEPIQRLQNARPPACC